jgi:predicted acetyltransferase
MRSDIGFALGLVRVRHEATHVICARTGHLGDEVADEATGARFDRGDAEPMFRAALADLPGQAGQLGRVRDRIGGLAGGERIVRHG